MDLSITMGERHNNYLIPLSILVAGAVIAGAVIYAPARQGSIGEAGRPSDDINRGIAQALRGGVDMRAVDANDHVRGNPEAPVKLVEYSDLECPFCQRFHDTMNQIMEEYGKNGRVAWVYRHFPLDALHSKARKEAEAAECAGDLGGNTAFWDYIDIIFATTPANNRFDLTKLPDVAAQIGLDRAAFQTCLDSGKFAGRVADDLKDAQAAGGTGTPYSIVIAANGDRFPVNGAQPYEEVKRIIDLALLAK